MTTATTRRQRAHAFDQDLAAIAVTVGAVAVGAALIEVALVPGIVLGAAALVVPGLVPQRRLAWGWGRRTTQARVARPAVAAMLPKLRVGQAAAKTVSFRVIVASLDFAWNYVWLGELGTAAGLSALNLGVGPVFYFLHETAWNFYGAPAPGAGQVVQVRGVRLSRALAKTIVYETLGTVAEFTVNWIVVGDVVTAVIVTAPFAVLGPFIYAGHEKVWERFTERPKLSAPGD